MVFFTCDACGESIKKNAVEKHYQFQCRNSPGLSCVDCGKNFPGETYKEHIKCISEEEKYSGKGFKPKANANKGEVKQTLWLEQVHAAISKCGNSNFKLKSLLERLIDYPNIPRKKAKFENFVKNSIGIRDAGLTTRTWDVIAAEMSKSKPENGQSSNDAMPNGKNDHTKPEKANGAADMAEADGENDASEKKLNKRERKEMRRKQQHKEEKKSKKQKAKNEVDAEDEEPTLPVQKKKKAKKRKHEESENAEEEVVHSSKKQKKDKADKEVEEEPTVAEMPPAEKFTWEGAIIGALKREDDNELRIKKLRKKVLAQYYTYGTEAKVKTEDELFAKFNKKIKKNPRLRTLKDRVKLLG